MLLVLLELRLGELSVSAIIIHKSSQQNTSRAQCSCVAGFCHKVSWLGHGWRDLQWASMRDVEHGTCLDDHISDDDTDDRHKLF